MKKLIILTILSILYVSCNVNNIEIDEISRIDIFENYEDNLKLGKDIVNQNWNEYFKENIDGFDTSDIKDFKFFINTRPNEKIIVIQLRYPKFNKPKNLNKIRKLIVDEVEVSKKLYKKNEKLILESTKKVEALIQMLDDENYEAFYNNLHSKLKKLVSYEEFLNFIKQIKEMGFKKEQREYLNKNLIKFEDRSGELTDVIEYLYWQKGNHERYESFNFEKIDGKMEIVGYKVY